MAKFIGLKQKAGPYKLENEKTGEVIKEGKFHNFYLHYLDEADRSGESYIDSTPFESFIAKIKAEDVEKVFGFIVTTSNQFDSWFLKDIEILFDRKGNPASVRLLDESARENLLTPKKK